MKKYYICAYKHFWVDDDTIPIPYTKEKRDFVIEASSEKEAIAIAEEEYGSGKRIDPKTRQYATNADGSWTLMYVTKIEIMKTPAPDIVQDKDD